MSFGKELYDKQLEYLANKDIDPMIDNNYHEDAQLIGYEVVVTGRAALKTHFKGYLENLGKIDVKSTDFFKETDDTIFFEATVETKLGIVQVYDAMYFKDNKIYRHFTGIKKMGGE